MTPGFSTPGSTAVMQPPPPPQQQPHAAVQEQMQVMQQSLAAEMQSLKTTMQLSFTEALKEEIAPLSSRVSTLLSDVEDGKASRVIMRGELNKLNSKYDELAKGVASVKTLEASVSTCLQSMSKRMLAIEAAPVLGRSRDNAGNVAGKAGTPATAKKGAGAGGAASASKRVSKKAAAAVRAAEKAAADEAAAALEEDEDADADSDDERSPSLAERAAAIVAEGAEGALPQRTTPPRKAKRARTTIRIDS